MNLPSAGLMARSASASPLREKTKILPSATMGEAWPSPILMNQRSMSFSGGAGHFSAGAVPSRCGPRHCDQSGG
ncbi:MAG: hypothetical protein ACRD5W_00850 [Candidatus Acidiferrales bacterium]